MLLGLFTLTERLGSHFSPDSKKRRTRVCEWVRVGKERKKEPRWKMQGESEAENLRFFMWSYLKQSLTRAFNLCVFMDAGSQELFGKFLKLFKL